MRIMRALWRTAPPVLFVMAILSAGFFTGAWVVLSEVFPYDLLAAADKTLRTWVESRSMSICPDSHSRKTPAYSGCPGIRMAICW